jgi:hypothetical protein
MVLLPERRIDGSVANPARGGGMEKQHFPVFLPKEHEGLVIGQQGPYLPLK